MTDTMDKTFDHASIEASLSQAWQDQGYFCPNNHDNPYCIMLPPPNVTGHLHMGHGFQLTLMDALIRYHHMTGHQTLWQAGTDHAGIATQMVVERQLLAQNQTKESLGREAFTEKVWQWKDHSASTIEGQLKRMGASLDWDNACFTLDENVNHAVNVVFNQLYDEGLIYRDKRLVNWDTTLQTAVSDLEVESVAKPGFLWHINYPVTDSDKHITVATTRPETMLGDTAVAVHPDDSRYSKLIGKTIQLPLTDRQIPIIADEHVDPEFGTGAVKITPAHDFNDYAIGKRHKLPMINILNDDGTLNDQTPKAYQGLTCKQARKKIVEDLENQQALAATEPHQHQVPIGDRSGTVIEPMLTDQWFMAMESLAKPAIDAVKNGDIRFTPANWEKTYFQWLDGIQDWCLSRQLWWGHRIPAWYDDAGTPYVGLDEQHVREKYQLPADTALHQDDDVLDTWFSSALWPFVTLGWPEETPRLQAFYPTDVLVTGFDIIFFWVARMIMMGLKLTNKVPFKQVYVTGLIRDSHGQKMSKSKGNVLDPIDLIQGIKLDPLLEKRAHAMMQPQIKQRIEKQTRQEFPEGIAAYGTDALRFTYCALATHGRDINFDLNRLEGYRNFCNKIWNATRFILMQTENYQYHGMPTQLDNSQKWLLHKRDHVVNTVHKHYQQFRFDLIAQTLYEFTWQHTCDWALEFAKITMNHDDTTDDQRYACQTILLMTLADILRLLHPIMPFITDAIWPNIASKLSLTTPHLVLEAFPTPQQHHYPDEHDQMTMIQSVISSVRTLRSENDISPKQSISCLYIHTDDAALLNTITTEQTWIKALGKCERITPLTANTPPEPCFTAVLDSLSLHIPMSGLVNKQAELDKFKRMITKTQASLDQCMKKLNNPQYSQNAPAAVVQKEQDKADTLERELGQYQHRIDTLNHME
jgi:valyl-tRNA synthetase